MIPTSKLNQKNKKKKKKKNKRAFPERTKTARNSTDAAILSSKYIQYIYEYFSCVTEKSHLTRRKPQLSI